jgi:hypothetical protein
MIGNPGISCFQNDPSLSILSSEATLPASGQPDLEVPDLKTLVSMMDPG